jgi:hypothetical protein
MSTFSVDVRKGRVLKLRRDRILRVRFEAHRLLAHLVIAILMLSAIAGTALTLYAAPAASHVFGGFCSNSPPYYFYWPTASVQYTYPSSSDWTPYGPAIASAASEFGVSAFSYVYTAGSAPVAWHAEYQPDTVAGTTWDTVNCTTHLISHSDLYLNFPHFTATSHTFGQIKCTAVHEFGHGTGLGHANDYTSIMIQDHYSRCHSLLITTLQQHDRDDLYYIYGFSNGGPKCGGAPQLDPAASTGAPMGGSRPIGPYVFC